MKFGLYVHNYRNTLVSFLSHKTRPPLTIHGDASLSSPHRSPLAVLLISGNEAASSSTPATTATFLVSSDSLFVATLFRRRPTSETRLSISDSSLTF
ncbi:hypothetical protein L2E82_50737 [Cichorium intybus]|nr:hypothetical protein L2E82_50737 [Cichorium intybus]